jgi:hypothetical protein
MLQAFDDDMRRGSLQSTEELLIGALVMAPFVSVPVIMLYHLGWPPLLMLVLFAIVLEITAAVWNAGWRAREEPVREGAYLKDNGVSHAD